MRSSGFHGICSIKVMIDDCLPSNALYFHCETVSKTGRSVKNSKRRKMGEECEERKHFFPIFSHAVFELCLNLLNVWKRLTYS